MLLFNRKKTAKKNASAKPCFTDGTIGWSGHLEWDLRLYDLCYVVSTHLLWVGCIQYSWKQS